MPKQKKKLTSAQKAAKKKKRKEYMTIFLNGKQKRVKRPATIDGMDVDEFIKRNADPIWLHQNEMWEYIENEDDDFSALDDEDENEELSLVDMKMHLSRVFVSEDGDYYQVVFEDQSPDANQDEPDGKYFLIQRQFEFPDGGRIYIESDNQNYIGHFSVVKARINPKSFSLTLGRKKSFTIDVSFETSSEEYAEVKRILGVMIPNIEVIENS
jgi:hypothetical protein